MAVASAQLAKSVKESMVSPKVRVINPFFCPLLIANWQLMMPCTLHSALCLIDTCFSLLTFHFCLLTFHSAEDGGLLRSTDYSKANILINMERYK